jgi:hypothetical protein
MGRPTLNEDAKTFLDVLKNTGGSCGNYSLMRKLAWRDDRYWRTHATIIDEGFAVRGKGRGGSVVLIEESANFDAAVNQNQIGAAVSEQVAAIYLKEAELYPPSKQVIEDGWSRERSYDDFIVEITAQPGRVQTGGTWTRPDISLLGTKSYPYLPGRFFDIVTFEIKTAEALDVRGVFEALSHAQFATLAYVVFYTNGKEFKDYPNSERVIDLATKHGVGLIAAAQIDNYETWNEIIEPKRNIFDPEQANLFIGASLSVDSLSRVIKWHK